MTNRAARLSAPEEFPHNLRVEMMPDPDIAPGDILVRVAACAVCGTDVKKYFRGHTLIRSYPVTPGHEFSGVVAAVGSRAREFSVDGDDGMQVRRYAEGNRMVVAPVVACERCTNCREGRSEACLAREDIGFNYDGGFAEYVVIPEQVLRKQIPAVYAIPDSVSLWEAALAEPWACAIHAQKKVIRYGGWDLATERYCLREGFEAEDTVVVLGGGPLGCMHAELAGSLGAGRTVLAQRSEEKLVLAERLGVADDFVHNQRSDALKEHVDRITDGRGADVVITSCSSAAAQRQTLEIVKQGGFVSFFGGVTASEVPLPTNLIHYNGPLLGGTSGASPYHLGVALNLMAGGKIDSLKLVTHLLGLDYLEHILLLKGIPRDDIPGYASWDEAAARLQQEKDEAFFAPLGVDGRSDTNSHFRHYKDGMLKALVLPWLPAEEGIRNVADLSDVKKQDLLAELYRRYH